MAMKATVVETTVPDESAALTAAACLFHGFSDPSRLAIVRHLALGEHRVVDLTAHVGLAQSTVSKHLACLKDCGLVSSRPEGRASMWSLNHTDTVMEMLAAAERLLASPVTPSRCARSTAPPPSRARGSAVRVDAAAHRPPARALR